MSKHSGFLATIFNDSALGIDCGVVELKVLVSFELKIEKNQHYYYYKKKKIVVDQKDKKAKFFLVYDKEIHYFWLLRNNFKREFKLRTSIYLSTIKEKAFFDSDNLVEIITTLDNLKTDIKRYLKV